MILQENSVKDDKGRTVTFILHDTTEIKEGSPITQSYAFIFNKEGKLLIGKNPMQTEDSWTIPGGTLEKGENPDQALERELLEEVDAVCSRYELIAVQECIYPNNPRKLEGDHYYQLRYAGLLGELLEQTPDPDCDKVWERRFIDIKELPEYVYWGDKALIMAEKAWKKVQEWI